MTFMWIQLGPRKVGHINKATTCIFGLWYGTSNIGMVMCVYSNSFMYLVQKRYCTSSARYRCFQDKKISRSRSNLSHGRRKFSVVREYSIRSIKTVVLYTERVLNTKDKKVYQLEEYITLE